MVIFDSSIVNVVLFVMVEKFLVSMVFIEWVVISYLIVIVGIIFIFGRLVDIKGKIIIFKIGIVIFIIGFLICGIFNLLVMLVILRGF